MKAVIMVGLPSSGKSTYSKELGIRIISKDIIREAFPTMKEPDVRKLETQEIKDCALLGVDIVVDNTHLNNRTLNSVINLCEGLGYEVEVIDMFDYGESQKWRLDLYDYHQRCRARNTQRYKDVPNSVLDKMFLQKYGADTGFSMQEKIVLFDIDGTLADGKHRLHHLEGESKNRPAYFGELGEDSVIEPVKKMLEICAGGNVIVIMSGRPDSYCKETEKWLQENNIPYDYLLMRSHRDTRPDYDVKKELYEQCLKKDKDRIIGVFDDRPSVIKMRVEQGIFVFGCQQGYREF